MNFSYQGDSRGIYDEGYIKVLWVTHRFQNDLLNMVFKLQ